ncbi:MAG: hypothetical protein F4187_01565 [Gemmatimonadetes bacterium]|nr:hypothetical protein [Gemmatimonadota bacterium]
MDREARRPPRSEESRSQFARLGGMFFSPGRIFGELTRSPAIAAALMALALAGAVRATAVSRAGELDAVAQHTFEQQAERMPGTFARGMSDADRERAFEATRGALRLSRNFAPVLGGIGGALAPVAAAGFFLLLFGILGSPGSFRVILSTVAHAGWPPAAVSTVLTCLVVWLSHPMAPERAAEPLRAHFGAAVTSLDGAAAALASRVDLFLAWELALVTVGFAITVGVSRRRSFAVALGLWALVTAVAVGAALLANVVSFRIGSGPA